MKTAYCLFIFSHCHDYHDAYHALQRLEQFGKSRKEFAGDKGFARCETETTGAAKSTALFFWLLQVFRSSGAQETPGQRTMVFIPTLILLWLIMGCLRQ
jgi:hypothetical protein